MDILKRKKIIGIITGITVIFLVTFFSVSIFSKADKTENENIDLPKELFIENKVQMSYEGLPEIFKQSYEFEAKGQMKKAIGVLMDVYDKNNYIINLRLGWLFYSEKKYPESMDYYQNAINSMPMSIEARFGFILPASALEDWFKVVEKYNEILNIDPNNSTANYKLGLINYYRPDYPTAQKFFEKVANMYPFDYSSILMLGWTNYQLGKSAEAKSLFERALCIVPGDASALEGLGLIK